MKDTDRKHYNRWTIEKAKEAAKNYKTRSEFNRECPGAYGFLRRNHMLDTVGLDPVRKQNGYWTIERAKEAAKEAAKNHKTLKKFERECPGAYAVLRRAECLDECGIKRLIKPRGYYTKEKCIELSRKCKTRSEFEKKYPSAYNPSLKNGWLSEMVWLKPPKNVYKDGWNLYRYEFSDGCVYYGIATNLKRRDKEHRGLVKKHLNSAVYKHHIKTGLPVPVMEVLYKNLSVEDARKREDDLIISYREDHPTTALNVAKGGSVGGAAHRWSNKQLENTARRYRTKAEFRKECLGAYSTAKARGLLKEYTFLEDGNKMYRENYRMMRYNECYETAMKFNTIGELYKNEPSVYNSARRHKWLKDYTWLKRVKHEPWTKESIIEHIKNKGYKLLNEFQKGSQVVYNVSRRLGLTAEQLGLQRIQKPQRPFRYWSFENCKKVGLKDVSRGNFALNHRGAYMSACRNGWLDIIFGEKKN